MKDTCIMQDQFSTAILTRDFVAVTSHFRLSPYEWDNPHPCTEDPDELETCFNFQNCLWFGMGSLMCQGSDILPK